MAKVRLYDDHGNERVVDLCGEDDESTVSDYMHTCPMGKLILDEKECNCGPMGFAVFSESKKAAPGTTLLKLGHAGFDGAVKLVVCDSDGHQRKGGNILRIHPDGTLELHSYISTDLGIKLDGHRQIVVRRRS